MRYFVLIGAVLIAAAGYFFVWTGVATNFQSKAEDWIAQQRAQGQTVSHGDLALSGFPGLVQLDLPEAGIAAGFSGPATASERDGRLSWSWRTENLQLMVKPWQPHHLIAHLGLHHEVAWREGLGLLERRRATAGKALASMVADGQGGWLRASAEFENLLIENLAATDAISPTEVTRLTAHVRRDEALTPDDVEISLELVGLTLPGDVVELKGMGRKVTTVQLLAKLRGLHPKSAGAPEKPAGEGYDRGLAAEAIGEWRDRGGVADVARLNVVWDEIEILADGTLTLDKEMRPLGAMSAKIWGLESLLELLVRSGRIDARDSGLVAAALRIMSKTGDDGRLSVEAPVSLQDGHLYLGPFALLRLAPVILH
jgi:hypothetical protein